MVLSCGYVYDRYKQNKRLKKTWFLSKRENRLVTCHIEATICIKIGISQQYFACRVKKGCFTNMQNFNTIAQLHPY